MRSQAHSRPEAEIVVVGCGAVTSVGFNAPMTAASVRAGVCRSRMGEWVDRAGEPMVLSFAEFIDPRASAVERLLALACPAALEATEPLRQRGLDRWVFSGLAIYLGVASRQPAAATQRGQDLLDRLADAIGIPFPPQAGKVLAEGHASALRALQQAAAWIRAGGGDAALVGGVDSYCEPELLESLDETRRLHSESNNDGFVPGEGSGFCLIASADFVRRHSLEPLAVIRSVCSVDEPFPFDSTGVCIGEGLSSTLRTALATGSDTGMSDTEKACDWTICDLNGESFKSREWVYAYLRTGRKHRDPLELWHPADCYGDIGAASGAVLATLAVAAWERNYARGPRALLWTASDGKHRAAAVLEKPARR